MIRRVENTADVLDLITTYAVRAQSASYPRIFNRQDAEKTLKRAQQRNDADALGCYINGVLQGVCAYFWEEESGYAQTTLFIAQAEAAMAVYDEIFLYICVRHAGKTLHIGVAEENGQAREWLLSRGFECIEASDDWRFVNPMGASKTHSAKEEVRHIGEAEFKDYAPFHDRFARPLQMYYTSEKLHDCLKRFRVLTFEAHGEIRASIFARVFRGGAEVFGLFACEQVRNTDVPVQLLRALLRTLSHEKTRMKQIVYMIDIENEWERVAAKAAGFIHQGGYRCYRCKLRYEGGKIS